MTPSRKGQGKRGATRANTQSIWVSYRRRGTSRAPIRRSRFRLAGERTDAILQGMKPTAKLHQAGQSLWLDNISREMLDSGQLQRYIDEYSVTGLTSNPSIFDKAIASGAYDDEIRRQAAARNPEELFFELAFKDLRRAADLFEPI